MDVATTSNLNEDTLVLLTQYVDESPALKTFDTLLQDIATRRLLVLCANADKTATVGDKIRYCAGTLAEKIENFNDVVQYYGKPHAALFDSILNQLTTVHNIPKDRIVFVGDTLEKDIKAAKNYGIDSVLALTGTTARDIQHSKLTSKQALKRLCKRNQAVPTYCLQSL